MSDSCDSSEDWCEPYGAPVSAGRYPVLVECERELLECTGSPVPVGARLAATSAASTSVPNFVMRRMPPMSNTVAAPPPVQADRQAIHRRAG